MIVFLTLSYCILLALLVNKGVVPWTLWWKLSPLAWVLLLLLVLFFPMQWGAPMGPANVYQNVVEIVPNVSGQVIDVPIEGLQPLKKGDVLFQIDRTPYQAVVDRLKAQLADAKQNVEGLKAAAEAAQATVSKTQADIELAKADQSTAKASVAAAQAALEEAKGKKARAVSVVADLGLQVKAAQREYDRTQALLPSGAVTQAQMDRTIVQVTRLKSQLHAADIDVRIAGDAIERSEANVTAAESSLGSTVLRVQQLLETELPRVRAEARRVELLATSMIGSEPTSVAIVRAQLEKAQFDLDQTTVRAPSDGMVVGMTLSPGQRVGTLPMRSWMSFVPSADTRLVVGVPQYTLRYVKPGQTAEVTLKLYPGQVFSATVDEIVTINKQGQVRPSGVLAATPGVGQKSVPFAVRLKLDDDADLNLQSLPGGAFGTAAIFTDKMRPIHSIRRVMLRMTAWLNYVVPW